VPFRNQPSPLIRRTFQQNVGCVEEKRLTLLARLDLDSNFYRVETITLQRKSSPSYLAKIVHPLQE
jgi:hypothetical protein